MSFDYDELQEEYQELDAELTRFREAYNRQARKDLRDVKKHKPVEPQAPLPDWVEAAIARWRELRSILNIR